MRNSLLLNLLSLVICLGSVMPICLGNTIEPISTTVTEKAIILSWEETSSAEVEVEIADQYGIVLLNEKFDVNQIRSKKYNFKNLVNGSYTLEIKDGAKISSKTIEVNYDKVQITKEDVLFKPQIRFEDNTWKVSHLSLGKNVTVKIYDELDHELLSEDFQEQNINRVYSLNDLATGEYVLTFMVEGKIFETIVSI